MNTSFFGIKHHSSLKAYNTSSNHLELLKTRSLLQKTKKWCTVYAKHRHPIRQDFSFSCQNVNLLRLHHVFNSGSRLKCTKKSRFSSLSFTPLWKERIFLIRVCVYSVVISGLFLLVWFGSNKVKGYVEAKLLPSVCLVISERIQREFRIGKVRRISPLSLTLESCSFGPHREEFSCGEVPIVKLRLHPFASLMRGKVVVDAVLSHSSVLIVQKKDYSWLGIPESEGGVKRNLSAEEGIDHRTRTRRLAQEEAAARSERARDDDAREAAKIGYFVSESSQGDDLKETQVHSRGETGSNSFFCMSEGKHDHHCVDKGVDYDMKHAALEKPFRVKFPGSSGLRFWSRVIKRYGKHKFKRKSKRSDISASGVAIKKRIFECSASAARAYFRGQSQGKSEEPSSSSGCFHSMNLDDKHLIENDIDKITESLASGDDDKDIVAENGVDVLQPEGLTETLPVMLDSVHFRGATVMLLAYGDNEVREMENVNGHVKFRNHYNHINVQLNGNCKPWRSDVICKDGGWLSADVFIDILEQNWHTNLKIDNLYVPLFERILEIPITWSKGRASGELHLCMSKGETFPNIHGQLDVTGLNFQLLDASSCFSNVSASLCFRVQRIFLHNACGWFGSIPLEASGDFGIHPDEGELHIKCEVPGVEVNALMKTFNMESFSFPLAGSVTALFNCQGPLGNPIFVGTATVSTTSPSLHDDTPATVASEALAKSKEAGAVAAFDRVPFSYVSANFSFNTDNCVADLYGIRASLVDGGEIQGAGTAWICPEGEEDETAIDVNFSGNLAVENIFLRYVPDYHSLMPLKLGVIHGETKILGPLSRPKLDIKWTAPSAEGSFSDARGDIIISHDFISVNSASAAFDLYMKVQTSSEEFCAPKVIPFTVGKIEFDLNMHEFEFFRLVTTYTLDFPRPLLLKASGRVKFQGKLLEKGSSDCLVGEVSISGLKLNQLLLAPQLSGLLRVSPECIKLDASGRPDESFEVEFIRPLQSGDEDDLKSGQLLFISLQKGKLGASVNIQQSLSASLDIQNFPLDELELASLRGIIQRAEIKANLQKRRGHGILSVLQPKFIGVLGKSLDVAARWSGDVITIEKVIFEQSNSHYELQGEYVLPGNRNHNPVDGKGDGFLKSRVSGNLGSVISSMGRWRMKLEVCRAEIAEMLPLARLLSRSMDPSVLSRSKDFFIRSLQSVGLYSTSSQQLLELIRGHHDLSHDVVHEDLNLPDLFDLRGRWHGSVGASGGGDGDTLAKFDIHGEDWELGDYKAQCILGVGAYSNDNGMHMKNFLIQNDNATIHADGNLLGPKTNLHFAVLNFPVSLVPNVAQLVESTATNSLHSLEPLLAPIKGILHMEGDLRGSLTKPECDVQIRLLDGSVGGIDLERAEVVASLTSTSRFLFNAKFEPIIQNGHVLIQGSIPVTFVQNNMLPQDEELDQSGATLFSDWARKKNRGTAADASNKNTFRDRNEEVWNTRLAKSLEGLYLQNLDVGEIRVDADIKDGGMMLITALTPYADWLHGNADVMLEVRGTVDQPLLNGYAMFHRASISSPVFRKPLTNFGGTVQMKSNRLSITSLESRLSGKGKLLVKGNLPLRPSEETLDDKIELKCDVLEVHAKNILSGQVDSQLQITGSILQPVVSGNVKLSRGEVYLPQDGGSGDSQALASNQSAVSAGGDSQEFASRYISQYFGSRSASLTTKSSQSSSSVSGSSDADKDMEKMLIKPSIETRLSDLKLVLGPELKIVYPLILIFTVSGELELNGLAHPKCITPRGILVFENGEVELLATQVRLKREHLNIAKFEPEYGLDPMLDLALVGSQFQYRIQGRASNWQGSVEQDTLSPIEAVRKFESQLAESILKGNGQLALEKLATATLEKLMPRIEGKGEFGNARWRIMYSPQIPSLISSGATVDTFEFLAGNLTFGTDVEVQLGKRLQARVTRQMKDSEMATQWSLSYQLTSRLHLRLQSSPLLCIFFEYYATT
ncbi:protein TIC236, chloroplastic [Lathyrus oleraceus]|uniref:Protein SUBSTANDARD STARCH GRAIN 4 n=3 Tax=Pisum sativum TaxID=3888 RepID=A0A9D4WKR1_PEA|nr:protein TIC236, chloroplastic-like [Pisum sativum]KAI5403590.1 Protein SUBSTANDARD STARCH GRAIN 4 [Pisum sativum]